MKNGRPRILMYHGVCRFANDPNETCTSPECFREQMRYLRARNLRGVSLRELRRAATQRNAQGLVGLTFDDGCEDFLQTALPILENFGFTATVFVVSGMLGQENDWKYYYEPKPCLKLLDAEGVREIAARGMEVGSHSVKPS